MAGISEAEGFSSGMAAAALQAMLVYRAHVDEDEFWSSLFDEVTIKLVRLRFAQFGIPLGQKQPSAVNGDVILQCHPAEGSDFVVGAPGTAPQGIIEALSLVNANGRVLVTINGLHTSFADLFRPVARDAAAFLQAGPTLYSGNSAAGRAHGGAGVDTLSGGGGADTLFGDAGRDTLNGDAGRDHLLGGDQADGLFGGAGLDWLQGQNGADLLSGGDGTDSLYGGAGNDRLAGSFGADFLRGGGGADSFVYQTLPAVNPQESGVLHRDTIADFQPGTDKIDVGFILATPFQFLGKDATLTGEGQIRYRHAGGDTIVDISTDADAGIELSIRLTGHLTLHAGDFVL